MGGEFEGGGEDQVPLLQPSSSGVQPLHTSIKRTGTLWTAVAHIITGLIGSGVLSLAWSVAQLGWIAGPITILLFAVITLFSTFLLCDCYMFPDPETGPNRHHSYLEAINIRIGGTSAWLCGLCIYVSLYGYGVAYTITSAISIRAIQKSNCYHDEGHAATCAYGDTLYIVIFGVIQLVVSQIPNFHNIDWLSIVAAAMSFSYSTIGFGLGIAKVIGNGVVKGSISGISASSAIDKVWLVAQALGDIAFAYPYPLIVFEIQDTLKSPPSETQTMKKASSLSLFITTLFYLLCGGFGYAAFGDDTPGNLLTGFGFYEPYWLVDFANACVVVHLVGGYQIYSQPLFGVVDRWFTNKFPESGFINKEYNLNVPFLPTPTLNLYRLCFRTLYVASTTTVALLFPYFNEVIGVIGGLTFWPLAIYFPVRMYMSQTKVEKWSNKWIGFYAFSFICLLISLFAFTGSFEGVIVAKLS